MAERFDALVVGGGIAGLSFALKCAAHGRVAVLTKRQRSEGATNYAQGGIASVLSEDDSFEQHVQDTLVAGAGLCRREAVELCVRQGPARLRELVQLGAHFSPGERGHEFDLTREGGHTRRRIVHAQDLTGREVERALLAACDEQRDRIAFFENHAAVDLILSERKGGRCVGAYVLDSRAGEVRTFLAPVTVLATGGSGKVYLYTTNPDVATGDGVAMAYRAGATIANMEFMQFHPTCLYHPQARNFLISEALRGEGGILRLRSGQTFMERYHPQRELAPRDVVARAIDAEMKRTGDDYVVLDMTHLSRAFLLERFPNIYATCREYGIDMAAQPIPVVPAAHYQCGGVDTDLHGQTDVAGLLAIGEVACTGLHGANRLASNSLLEGLVFAHAAAAAAAEIAGQSKLPSSVPEWDVGKAVDSDERVVVTQNWDEVRRLMWNYVGIVRTDKRLERARRRLELLREEIRQYYWDTRVNSDLVELRNIAEVASLVVECATRRKESRGLHYTLDYPKTSERAEETRLKRERS
ncbi:MAG TPA: L-aspartate oxidase [Myxococcales bacterium]|nr:L-aspartate oxidase [Myxococcales bacterium]